MPARRKYPVELIERAVEWSQRSSAKPRSGGDHPRAGDLLDIPPEALRHWVKKHEAGLPHRLPLLVMSVSGSGNWRGRTSNCGANELLRLRPHITDRVRNRLTTSAPVSTNPSTRDIPAPCRTRNGSASRSGSRWQSERW